MVGMEQALNKYSLIGKQRRTQTCSEGTGTQCCENTVHIVSDQGACSFAMGQRWAHIGRFELECWILSFAISRTSYMSSSPCNEVEHEKFVDGTD